MPDPTLDTAALVDLLETVGDDPEFLAELIDTYLADGPGLLAELRAGLSSGDGAAVRRAAHTLKSTSATFGATRLAALGREMEAAADTGDLAAVASRVETAETEFAAVTIELRATAGAGITSRSGAS